MRGSLRTLQSMQPVQPLCGGKPVQSLRAVQPLRSRLRALQSMRAV